MERSFQYQALATYNVVPQDMVNGGAGRLCTGLLYLCRHGKLQDTPLGEFRGATLYLIDTDIVIGTLTGAVLTLTRTRATFTLEIVDVS